MHSDVRISPSILSADFMNMERDIEAVTMGGADEDDGVLLEVVALARDVCGDLDAVDETDTGDLAQGRVRLLGGGREDAGAHATLLRVVLESGVLRLGLVGNAALADELVDSRQS